MQHPQPTTETTTSVCPSSPLPPTPPRCNPPSPLTSPPPPMSCHHRLLLLLLLLVGASNQTALDTGEHLRTTQPTSLWRRRPHSAAWSISYDFFETSLISGPPFVSINGEKCAEEDIWKGYMVDWCLAQAPFCPKEINVRTTVRSSSIHYLFRWRINIYAAFYRAGIN